MKYFVRSLPIVIIIVLAFLTGACSRIREFIEETPTPQPTTTLEVVTPQPTVTPYLPIQPVNSHPDCPVTTLMPGPPPSKQAAQFPAVGWYQSKDGKLWTGISGSAMVYSGNTTFAWSKPAGSRLIVSGKRIDGQSPPFHASIPDTLAGDFQLATLIFPSPGCWSVQAQAGSSAMDFILYVEPNLAPQGGECANLDDAVRLADAILVAKVTHTDTSKDYAWQSLQVLEVWKNPFQKDFDPSIELLQTLSQEPSLENGKTYLLFLQYTPWQTVCSQQTIAEVTDKSVRLISGVDAFWKGNTLSEIKQEVLTIFTP